MNKKQISKWAHLPPLEIDHIPVACIFLLSSKCPAKCEYMKSEISCIESSWDVQSASGQIYPLTAITYCRPHLEGHADIRSACNQSNPLLSYTIRASRSSEAALKLEWIQNCTFTIQIKRVPHGNKHAHPSHANQMFLAHI